VPQQLLSCFEVNTLLPKHDGEPMAEGVKADPLRDSNLLQRRPDMTPEDHIGLQRLRPVLGHRREQVARRSLRDSIRTGTVQPSALVPDQITGHSKLFARFTIYARA
jgi:hypothetical protein